MFVTGYLSSTGSYSASLPWSGDAFLPLLRPTSEIFAIPPWAPEVAVPSGQWNGVLFVPLARRPTSTRQTRAFSVGGPSVSNGLPLAQLLPGRVHYDAFYSSLKIALFSRAR